MDDCVTHFIVTYDNETSVRAADCVIHQKGLHATLKLILEVRTVNVIMIIKKITRLRCGEYCTSNPSTLYSQPGTHVSGTEEKAFLKAPWLLMIP